MSNLVVSLGPSLITHEFWVHTFGRSETLFLGSFDTISVGFVSLITGGVILLLDHDEKLRDNDTRQQETRRQKKKKVSTMSIPMDRDKKRGAMKVEMERLCFSTNTNDPTQLEPLMNALEMNV